MGDITERLYQLNAWISGRFITRLHKPTVEDMEAINRTLGNIIKDMRLIEKWSPEYTEEFIEKLKNMPVNKGSGWQNLRKKE